VKVRLVPESLFGRLLTALLAAIGITLIIIVALLLRERRDLLFSGSETAAIVDIVASTADALAALSGDARAAEIARLQREPFVIAEAAGQSRQRPAVPANPAATVRLLRERLTRELGPDYAVAVAPARPGPTDAIRVGRQSRGSFGRDGAERGRGADGEAQRSFGSGPGGERLNGRPGGGGFAWQLDVAVTLPDGAIVQFRTDAPRAPPPLPMALLLELALVTLVLGAVLYVMARTITRPLAALAAAAEAVGRGERHLPLRETGARELRDATRAFNTMHERLNRYLDSRTRVLSAMSHDLRTPLTRLKLRAEGLGDEQLRDRFNADLDEMNRMVTGALNLFRGLNHDEPLQPVRIETLLHELRAEFAELQAKVTVTGGTAAPVNVRPDALKRCLTNLISNAVKYGVSAAVLVEEDAADVIVRVLDEGPGIPEAMLERVFEPFFRLESSRSADTGGTGLGLSIARDIAQAHGGSLVLRNRTPRGLEAILRLPKALPR
jgi:signal transduction histidine kinase